jgi:hypothetical protein
VALVKILYEKRSHNMEAVKVLKKGEVIFKEGDLENCMYKIITEVLGFMQITGKKKKSFWWI